MGDIDAEQILELNIFTLKIKLMAFKILLSILRVNPFNIRNTRELKDDTILNASSFFMQDWFKSCVNNSSSCKKAQVIVNQAIISRSLGLKVRVQTLVPKFLLTLDFTSFAEPRLTQPLCKLQGYKLTSKCRNTVWVWKTLKHEGNFRSKTNLFCSVQGMFARLLKQAFYFRPLILFKIFIHPFRWVG